MDGRKEAVSSSRDGFHKTGILGAVSKCVPQPLYGSIQAVFKIYKGVSGPKPVSQFFPCNNFTRMLQEHSQDLERLLLKPDLPAIPAEFSRTQVRLISSESNDAFSQILGHLVPASGANLRFPTCT